MPCYRRLTRNPEKRRVRGIFRPPPDLPYAIRWWVFGATQTSLEKRWRQIHMMAGPIIVVRELRGPLSFGRPEQMAPQQVEQFQKEPPTEELATWSVAENPFVRFPVVTRKGKQLTVESFNGALSFWSNTTPLFGITKDPTRKGYFIDAIAGPGGLWFHKDGLSLKDAVGWMKILDLEPRTVRTLLRKLAKRTIWTAD